MTHAFIGRCPAKGCKTAARVTTTETTTVHVDNRFGGYDTDVPAFILPIARPGDWANIVTVTNAIRRGLMPHCVKHQRQLRFREIEHKRNDGIVCNARCQAAKGPQCECSCDGHNHGKAWG